MAKPKRRGTVAATVDDHVAAQVRHLRATRGLSQRQLAKMIGISNQQQCNYERGRRSISAARLFETALALNVPISFFYERIEEKEPRPAPAHRKCLLEMIRSFAAIPNDRHAEAIYQATLLLSRSVAEAAGR